MNYTYRPKGESRTMKTACLRSLRFLLVASLFVLSFATFSSIRLEGSIGKAGNEFDYFSDATLRHQIGFIIFCRSGQIIRSGQTSQFVKVQPAGC